MYEKEKPKISKEAEKFIEETSKVMNDLYEAYGSGTGVLFGIPANLKTAVQAIVEVITRNRIKKEKVKEFIDTGKNPVCTKCSDYIKKKLKL